MTSAFSLGGLVRYVERWRPKENAVLVSERELKESVAASVEIRRVLFWGIPTSHGGLRTLADRCERSGLAMSTVPRGVRLQC